jgi:hypothetical protein
MNVQDCLLFIKKSFLLTFLHILCHKRVGGLRAPGARGGKKEKKPQRREGKKQEGKDGRAKTGRSPAI